MAAVITRANEPGAVPRTVFFGLLNDVASDPQVTDLAVTCDGPRLGGPRATACEKQYCVCRFARRK